jgi:hypothetical protein
MGVPAYKLIEPRKRRCVEGHHGPIVGNEIPHLILPAYFSWTTPSATISGDGE